MAHQCEGCTHKQHPDGGWCYMFKTIQPGCRLKVKGRTSVRAERKTKDFDTCEPVQEVLPMTKPISSVRDVKVLPIPKGESIDVSKVFQNRGVTVVVGSDGTLYSDAIEGTLCSDAIDGTHTYSINSSSRIKAMLGGLVKCGVLSAKALKEFEADQARQEEQERREWSASTITIYMKELGIELSKSQKATLASITSTPPKGHKNVSTQQES